MKPKSFEQKLKRDMYAMGVLFLIFVAVFILTKMALMYPLFLPLDSSQLRTPFRRPACPHGYTPA